MRITIDIPDDAVMDLENHRKTLYSHCKKLSRMFLEIAMSDMRKIKTQQESK